MESALIGDKMGGWTKVVGCVDICNNENKKGRFCDVLLDSIINWKVFVVQHHLTDRFS